MIIYFNGNGHERYQLHPVLMSIVRINLDICYNHLPDIKLAEVQYIQRILIYR